MNPKIIETEGNHYSLNMCPFCNSRDVVLVDQEVDRFPEYDKVVFARCKQCHAQGPVGESPTEAISGWNTTHAMFRNPDVSMARLLRYTTVQNLFDCERISESEAIELLRGELAPGDPDTIYDDSDELIFSQRPNSLVTRC